MCCCWKTRNSAEMLLFCFSPASCIMTGIQIWQHRWQSWPTHSQTVHLRTDYCMLLLLDSRQSKVLCVIIVFFTSEITLLPWYVSQWDYWKSCGLHFRAMSLLYMCVCVVCVSEYLLLWVSRRSLSNELTFHLDICLSCWFTLTLG